MITGINLNLTEEEAESLKKSLDNNFEESPKEPKVKKMSGQLRFSMYFAWQIGLLFRIEEDFIQLSIPFIDIFIATSKEAEGCEIFYWHYKD